MTRTENLADEDPRTIARALLVEFGFSVDQFGCLDSLWIAREQLADPRRQPDSSAYGIPQALPGSKMSSAGADWATNPVTQIRWGLGYIQDRYGTPCGAWALQAGPRLVLRATPRLVLTAGRVFTVLPRKRQGFGTLAGGFPDSPGP